MFKCAILRKKLLEKKGIDFGVYDPFISQEVIKEIGFKYYPLKRVDILVVGTDHSSLGKDNINLIGENTIIIDFQMKTLKARYLTISCNQRIETTSLMEFCSIIISCKKLYCLTSGTATLAAALQKPATVFFGSGQESIYHHSSLHIYVDLGTNYSLLHKVKKKAVLLLNKFIRLSPR